ncbi:retinoschisin-like [Strongylocentrotus purpuratus]|uniref:F5/8 type C domain-containing protein n=1 Tax=Strongylocentrotus purpuratus TaxID=7668 RepID=A0A7M7P5B2_STRPU|nr:retinoschisin-like [Strongylocentrotus purpuratus]
MYRIDGVSTQGRVHRVQWVTDYKINYSVDGITFDTVQDILTYPATDKVFAGNSDTDTVVYNALPQPKVCRYVRLLPVDWFSKIALRMELYGEPPVMGQ